MDHLSNKRHFADFTVIAPLTDVLLWPDSNSFSHRFSKFLLNSLKLQVLSFYFLRVVASLLCASVVFWIDEKTSIDLSVTCGGKRLDFFLNIFSLLSVFWDVIHMQIGSNFYLSGFFVPISFVSCTSTFICPCQVCAPVVEWYWD